MRHSKKHNNTIDIKHLNRYGWALLLVTLLVALGGGTFVLACVGQQWPQLARLGEAWVAVPLLLGWLTFIAGARVLAMTGRSNFRGKKTTRDNPCKQTLDDVEHERLEDLDLDR